MHHESTSCFVCLHYDTLGKSVLFSMEDNQSWTSAVSRRHRMSQFCISDCLCESCISMHYSLVILKDAMVWPSKVNSADRYCKIFCEVLCMFLPLMTKYTIFLVDHFFGSAHTSVTIISAPHYKVLHLDDWTMRWVFSKLFSFFRNISGFT